MKTFARFYFKPTLPLGPGRTPITASNEHIELSRRAAGEGMVLLENRGVLPLEKGARVALFGKATVDYIKGGGGSGDVYTPYVRNLYEGMQIKEKEGKISLFHPLADFYVRYVAEQSKKRTEEAPARWAPVHAMAPGLAKQHAAAEQFLRSQLPEAELTDEQIAEARRGADVAVISFCRYSGEDWDRTDNREIGDFYLTAAERRLVEQVTAAFDRVVVVLNVGGMVDTDWFAHDEKIGAALLAWQAGTEGGLAEADILCGDVNPSGKLTDTFARSFDDYPSSATFNESDDYVEYHEDIFVGYRYFETIQGAAARVNYPFGFGLSYTTFAITPLSGCEEDGKIKLSVRVENTGSRPGREVVQAYVQAPQGRLGKAARSLCAFEKTPLLAPGESIDLELTVDPALMASFDDLGRVEKGAYLLEAGDYRFHIGSSVRDTKEAPFVWSLPETRVTFRALASVHPVRDLKRLTASGEWETVPGEPETPAPCKDTYPQGKAPERILGFFRVADGEISMEDFMAQMTDEELVHVLCGQKNYGVNNTGCFGGVDRLAIPYVPTEDGPAGVRINAECGIPTTAWPCATLLACTWDPAILEAVGRAGALEMKENNLGVWLTPGMNIHRSPLCGRNFEYYSEDPFVAGKAAAALVRGIQSEKIAATPKHFCCNNKEINRGQSDSRVSERALREIYLRGFEIVVREADPWTIMTSYNRVNSRFPSETSALLEGILRREWGFSGMVMTDWTNQADQLLEIPAGNDLRMPMRACDEPRVLEAVRDGRISRETLIRAARRVLEMFVKLG